MLYDQLSLFDIGRGDEKQVRRIKPSDAAPMIREVHYSRKVPNITDAFGLFEGGGVLTGVCTFGIPASRPLCVGLAGKENADRVKELNRLVIRPGYNGENRASFLVSHALKQLDSGTYVVSFADPTWTHVGYVYQACNFIYTGLSAKRVDYYQPDGRHPRTLTNGKYHTDVLQTRIRKHRYVYLVGDRRMKRRMMKNLKYPVVAEYPKGTETRYDIDNPQPAKHVEILERKKPYRPRNSQRDS